MPIPRPPLFILFLLVLALAPAAPARAETFPEVSIFIDADQSFVSRAGGAAGAQALIEGMAAKVDAIYRSQLGLTVRVAGVHLWESADPFNRSSQSALLASFAAYAETTYRGQATYDVGYLLVGEGLSGEGGIAYSGAACGDVSSAPFAYGLSQPDFTDTYEFNPHLFSHELGHLLNAEHDAFPSCAVKTIMCAAQIGGSFSDASKSEIAAYVQSRQSAGCFPAVEKTDPAAAVALQVGVAGSTISYQIAGAGQCTTLTVVGAPSRRGLSTIFGYLQLGTVTPSDSIGAVSKKAPALVGGAKLFVGVYCDGQLTRTARVNTSKIQSTRFTTSAVVALRALRRGFRAN